MINQRKMQSLQDQLPAGDFMAALAVVIRSAGGAILAKELPRCTLVNLLRSKNISAGIVDLGTRSWGATQGWLGVGLCN
jgi:hypothetical protein